MSSPVSSVPIHAGTRLLRSGPFVLEVMEPDAPDRYHASLRYATVGAVLRASFRGREYFYSPVEHDRFRVHGGLAMEFDIGDNTLPLGYAEARIGGPFLKIGVGALRKLQDEYRFFAPFPLLIPARTEAEWSVDRVRFVQTCGVEGYAYRLECAVGTEGDEIVVGYRLENTGERPFVTEHYSHNFFQFDGAITGPDYEVVFPHDVGPGRPVPPGKRPRVARSGNVLSFVREFEFLFNEDVEVPSGFAGENRIVTAHRGKGMAIASSVDLPPRRHVVHVGPDYVCPEQFVEIALKPGEEQEWTRRYKFV